MDVSICNSMGPRSFVPEGEPCAAELAALQDIATDEWAGHDASAPLHVSLLELVEAVSEVADSEQEVVATVAHMLRSGSVVIRGSSHQQPLSELLQAC